MNRRVKEFVEIGEHVSLDDLIGKLVAVRDGLPGGSEAELRLRGDEVFGRRITISYLRDQTDEEVEFDRRYSEESREAKERELQRLQEELVGALVEIGDRGNRFERLLVGAREAVQARDDVLELVLVEPHVVLDLAVATFALVDHHPVETWCQPLDRLQ